MGLMDENCSKSCAISFFLHSTTTICYASKYKHMLISDPMNASKWTNVKRSGKMQHFLTTGSDHLHQLADRRTKFDVNKNSIKIQNHPKIFPPKLMRDQVFDIIINISMIGRANNFPICSRWWKNILVTLESSQNKSIDDVNKYFLHTFPLSTADWEQEEKKLKVRQFVGFSVRLMLKPTWRRVSGLDISNGEVNGTDERFSKRIKISLRQNDDAQSLTN